MTRLVFELSERQSSYHANVADNKSIRAVSFTAEPKKDPSINGRTWVGVDYLDIFEGKPDKTVGEISCTYSGPVVDGKSMGALVGLTVRLPEKVFQQLLDTDLEESTIWLHVEAMLGPEKFDNEHGHAESDLISARVSFVPKQQLNQSIKPPSPAPDYIQRIFWAIVIFGGLILWRLY